MLTLASSVIANETSLVVAIHVSAGVETLTRDQVINIFLGRFRQLPNGHLAIPIDQDSDHPIRAEFYRRLVGKNPAEIHAYWARLIFSGKTTPPREAESEEQIIQWLMTEPGAIGYLPADRLREPLKAVFTLDP
ncbi:hypothetical protein ThidrDRAFT_3126 [Thiorhodococcus drewsii AZ1]|uniref:Phosphate ABC transporter substrate-binding protein n=2 Tax=Thiorhodococcus drewsii TaxID=210408 RepID=G2E4B3_9GAMM|nr:hypothetical protein ThidrDRAFT_3126 [Thiorhodococcus drewsii AZ1]